MKTRHIKFSMAGLMLCLSLLGCKKDFLDIEPTDKVTEQSVYNTTDGIQGALNGVIRMMHSRLDPPDSQGNFGECSFKIVIDQMGDDLVRSTADNRWFLDTYRWLGHRSVSSDEAANPYRYYYRMIADLNAILEHIDAAKGTQSDKSNLKGQALTFRAFAYSRLVAFYGRRYEAGAPNTQLGVPLIIKSSFDKMPRASVEEVYRQINADLDQAIALLPQAPERKNKSEVNLQVAQGLKARTALTQGNWGDAQKFAKLARRGYPLMESNSYTAGFNKLDNSEWIWGSQQITSEQGSFASFFAYMSCNFSSTYIRTSPHAINRLLYEQIPAGDIRLRNFAVKGLAKSELPTATSSKSCPYQSRKFLATSPSESTGDVPHLRSAEMYLTEAEALARQGGHDAEAANVLFELNSKRNANYARTAKTGQALIDHILLYRRIELWGEGFRYTDLKRLNLPLDRRNSNHSATLTGNVLEVPAGDIRWEFVIPQAEINTNDLIKQNPL